MDNDESTFRITGCVASPRQGGANPRIAPSGKVGNLKIEVCRPGRDGGRPMRSFLEVVGFGETVEQMQALASGEHVLVTGELQTEKQVDRAKNAVRVDGYEVWITRLVARKIETLSQSAKQQPRTAQAFTAVPASDDDIPF